MQLPRGVIIALPVTKISNNLLQCPHLRNHHGLISPDWYQALFWVLAFLPVCFSHFGDGGLLNLCLPSNVYDKLCFRITTWQRVDIVLLKQTKGSKAGLLLIGRQPGESLYTLEDSGCPSMSRETSCHGGARRSIDSKMDVS